MLEKIKNLFKDLNEYGIPLPMVRDPKAGKSSVSLTMMFISFNVVFIGLIGKWAKVLDIDIQQALYWFGMTSALYFSRKLSGNSKEGVLQLDNNSSQEGK